MIVTYAPEGGQSQRWQFAPSAVKARQAEDIERRYGNGWAAWVNAVRDGSAAARRVLLWHLLRRDHAALRYDDTPDFAMGELVVELDTAELQAIRDRATGNADLDAEVRDEIVAAIDAEIKEAQAKADAAGEAAPMGKASENSAG